MNARPRWERVLLLNGGAAIGIAVALASTDANGLQYVARAGVFILAFLNFMFFVVQPRALASRTAARPSLTTLEVFVRVIREQPFILVIAVLLLIGSSRSSAAAVGFAHWSGSAYVRGLPNSSVVIPRMIAMSAVMTGIALLWFVNAVGVWARRPWAWWLALGLKGLSAGISVVLQTLH